jgi:hypothetical protein
MKQATMPDMSCERPKFFESVRPTIALDEGETRDTFSKETVMESALPDKVSGIDVSMSNTFENQFASHYNSRVFPWALNYDCGGADYPDLFADWESLESSMVQRAGADPVKQLRERWRRINGEAILLPGAYAKMLARRPEMQIAGDWMCVLAAHNLHWRYAVLHSAFLVCKQRIAPGESMHANLDRLMTGLENIWKKIAENVVIVDKRRVPINGNLGLLFF